MYQVATGSLSAGEIAAPLRGVLNRQRNIFGLHLFRLFGLADLVVCPPDLFGRISKSHPDFHSVGISVSDVQPGRTADYGLRSLRLLTGSGAAGSITALKGELYGNKRQYSLE